MTAFETASFRRMMTSSEGVHKWKSLVDQMETPP
jgi:hypothetical protein